MLKWKLFSFTLTSLTLCLCYLGSSYAFEIKSMDPSNGSTETVTSYGGHTGHFAYLETDEPYFLVDWYVDGSWRYTSWGDGTKTKASFTPDPIYGCICGTDYTIKAVAEPWNEGAGSKSASYTLTVRKSVAASDGSIESDGYAAIVKYGWNGRISSSEQYARFLNESGATINVTFKFEYRVHLLNVNGNFKGQLYRQRPLDVRKNISVPAGESRSACYSHSWTVGEKDGLPGESAELGVMTTVDAGDPPKWEVSRTSLYDF